MGTYRVTPRAVEDIKSIGRYSLKQWGREQRDKYLRNLEKRFSWLADNPYLGEHCPEIEEGYYFYPQGAHLVFYLICDDGIDIIGVPHKRMYLADYFG